MFISLLNYIISAFGAVLGFILGLLPSSPFVLLNANNAIGAYLSTINFFIPVAEILVITQSWLLCVGVYYIYQIVLRWIKAI